MIRTLNKNTYEKTDIRRSEYSFTFLILSSIAGYIISGTSIAGLPSTLAVSLVASLSSSGGIAVLAGVLLGYLFNGRISAAIPQICTMLTLVAVSFVGYELLSRKCNAVKAALSSGLLFAFYGIGTAVIKDISVMIAAVVIIQSVMCGCFAYFITVAFETVKRSRGIILKGIEGASIGSVYILSVATLSSLSFWHINIGRIIGIFIMLLAIKKYKVLGGAVSGILTSCGVILCSASLGTTTMFLACAGLIAGLFSRFGSFAVIASFVISNFAGLLAIGITGDTFNMMFDVAIATVIYIILPSRVIEQLFESVGMSRFSGFAVAQNAEQKLSFASKTIHDVNLSLDEVSVAMTKKADKQPISETVCEKICGGCPYRLNCWEKSYDRTISSFINAEKEIEQSQSLGNGFDDYMSFCMQRDTVKDAFYTVYGQKRYNKSVAKRLGEMRGLLSDQFTAMQEMLSSLSAELSSYAFSDNDMSLKVREYFERRGIQNPKVCVYNNKFGFCEVEIYIPKEIMINDVNVCRDISDILDVDLEMPQNNTVGGLTRIEMWEKPPYSVETGASQLCGNGGEMTGDSYETFYETGAQSIIVLSDGMGSGKRAQLDSLLTSSLISRMLRAGIGYESAIRLVNSTLRVKSWEESFATVDIAIINLYNKTMGVIKSGGSATYVVRDDDITKIEIRSLPVGILEKVEPSVTSYELRPGDIVICASDGLSTESQDILKKIAIANKHLPSKTISERMINAVRNYNKEERTDDITVIVTKFLLREI